MPEHVLYSLPDEDVPADLVQLAALMPCTTQDLARRAELGPQVREFFTRAETQRAHTIPEIALALGGGPDDLVPLVLCLQDLIDADAVRHGPDAGLAGGTYMR